jgi:hypothetical protein
MADSPAAFPRPGRAVDPSDAVLRAAVDVEMSRLRGRLVRFLGRDPAAPPPAVLPRAAEPPAVARTTPADLSVSVSVSVSVPPPARVPRVPPTLPPSPEGRRHAVRSARPPRTITVASGWGERRR